VVAGEKVDCAMIVMAIIAEPCVGCVTWSGAGFLWLC
jgi:hypothetical protein